MIEFRSELSYAEIYESIDADQIVGEKFNGICGIGIYFVNLDRRLLRFYFYLSRSTCLPTFAYLVRELSRVERLNCGDDEMAGLLEKRCQNLGYIEPLCLFYYEDE